MIATVIDPEQWQATYEAASVPQQYDMLLEIVAQPLSPELIEDLDLEMLLVMMRDELVSRCLFDQALNLISTLRRQQPILHQREFAIFDSFLVEYSLYHNHPEQLRAALQQFFLNPAEDIDQTLAILDYLKFYNQTDLAVELSQSAYAIVSASPNAMLGVETRFSDVLLSDWIQQAYCQLKQHNFVDWNTFLATVDAYKFDQYGLVNRSIAIDEIRQYLASDGRPEPDFSTHFRRDRSEALRAVSVAFCCYMAEQKQVSFIGSRAIWEAVYTFWENRDLARSKLIHPESYFTFSQVELESYIGQKVGGVLSMQQAIGVALLWGIPYIYDLLKDQQIITTELHQHTLHVVVLLKTALMARCPNLWKYDFVHRWLPPSSLPAAELEAEKQQFVASFNRVIPLNEPVSDRASRLSSTY
jgi:hypothetical protein